jgi:hypothetical protein
MLMCALLFIPGAVAAQTKLEENVDRAVTILERFREIPEQAIPEAVISDAKGLAILTVVTTSRRTWTPSRQRAAASGSPGSAAVWAAACLRSVITSASSAS